MAPAGVLRQRVNASKAECNHTEGGDRPPLHGAATPGPVGPIEPLIDNQPRVDRCED
jgi:hypothetical protein